LRFREALAAALFFLAPSIAEAHPHVWVDSAAEVVFDTKGRIAAIRHHWLFDEEFSAYALQGLDADRDGKYSPEELKPLAKENVESLKDYDYFTFLSVGDYQAGFADPRDYYLEFAGGRLLLHFTLPLAMPLLTRGAVHLEVGDPEYYVAFSLPNTEAVRLDGAPDGCALTVHPARALDPAAAAALAAIGPEQRDLPADLQALAAGTENSADLKCASAAVESTGGETPPLPEGARPAHPADASAAAEALGQGGDLTARPSAPESESAAATPAAAPAATPPSSVRHGIFGSWMAQIRELQTIFNRQLTAGLKTLKSDGGFFWLGGLSFLYGIVHAAGPGHGKVVISSYLVANEARLRRGVAIAFISAFVQAVVAVAIIGTMAALLNMTRVAIDSTAKVFEAGSFALVALLGVYLVARKGRAALAALRGGDAHAHHHHGHGHEHHHEHGHAHDHGSDCHHHDPSPNPSPHLAPPERSPGFAKARGGGAFAGATAAVLSVGIRPCSGALIVLVFALSQGVFWAGVASTFVMALGTAMTVAVLAALAVGAKGFAKRLARGDDRIAGQVMLGLELAAAILITLLGAVLFVGTVFG
jgi:ABC-type nickel/cobalt efflux system permease component RcnA/ABC-type uncharacterized transport system substrate-binding protein